MILLNALYASIMTLCLTFMMWLVTDNKVSLEWSGGFFIGWFVGHCVYDAAAHYIVRKMNPDHDVYRR